MSGAPIVGIDVGGTFVRAIARDNGRPHAVGRWRTPDRPSDLCDVLHAIADAVGARPRGLGLALAAGVDASGKATHWPNRPAYVGFGFGEASRRVFGCDPTWLDDGAAAALAAHVAVSTEERRRGTTTLYVGLGTGVGAGVVVADRLYLGATGTAMALGHRRVRTAGDALCACGARGCLQAVAGGRALEVHARSEGLPPDRIAEMAGEGDPTAQRILASIAEPLSEALVDAIGLLDPHRVILGGGLTHAGTFLLGLLAAALGGRRSPGIRLTPCDEHGGALGAALWTEISERRRKT